MALGWQQGRGIRGRGTKLVESAGFWNSNGIQKTRQNLQLVEKLRRDEDSSGFECRSSVRKEAL
jgi:hypothetical protein